MGANSREAGPGSRQGTLPGGQGRARLQRRHALGVIAALVLALHWLVLASLPSRAGAPGAPARAPTFATRTLVAPAPTPAPAAASPRPSQAPPVSPARTARPPTRTPPPKRPAPAPRPAAQPAEQPAPGAAALEGADTGSHRLAALPAPDPEPPLPAPVQGAAGEPGLTLPADAETDAGAGAGAGAGKDANANANANANADADAGTGESTQASAHGLPDAAIAAATPAPTPPPAPAESPPPAAALSITPPGGRAAGPALDAAPPVRIPPPMRLEFDVTGQAKKFHYSARAELLWQHDGQHYQARQEISMLFLGARAQSSVGTLGPTGLLPQRFGDRARSERAAHFDYAQGRVTFSANTPGAPLAPGTQDRLSVFLQLGALLAAAPGHYPAGTRISVATVSARASDTWSFTVQPQETLDLPVGALAAIPLQRLPRPEHAHDQTAQIWLAPALGYLPVRIRIAQANGDFADLRLRAHSAP